MLVVILQIIQTERVVLVSTGLLVTIVAIVLLSMVTIGILTIKREKNLFRQIPFRVPKEFEKPNQKEGG
jgi:hypothetical protein